MDLQRLIERGKNILIKPKEEWPVIAGESETVASLYQNWILILAAITPVAVFIGLSVFGVRVPFVGSIRVGIVSGLTQMVLGYGVALGMSYVVALVIDALAPSFGGEKNLIQALKAAAYGWTAAWACGIFNLLPGLGLLALFGVAYSIYLLYLGLPVMMKCPQDRAGGYTATVVVIALVLGIVFGAIVGIVSGVSAIGRGALTGSLMGTSHDAGETVVHIDPNSPLAKLAAAGAKVEAAGKRMEQAEKSGDKDAQMKAAGQVMGAILSGGDQVEALAPDAIKPFLPDSLGGLKRTHMSAEKNGIMGVQVGKGEARYQDESGEHRIALEITDTGGAKGIVGFAGWAATEQDLEADWGYEKTYHDGGRLIHEEWHSDTKHGEYGLILGDRFAVKLDCDGYDMAQIKALAATLNLSGLEALKDQGVKKG